MKHRLKSCHNLYRIYDGTDQLFQPMLMLLYLHYISLLITDSCGGGVVVVAITLWFFRPQRISISSAQSSIILIPVHAIFITFLDLHQAHLRLFRSFRGWFAVPAGHHMWMSCWSESPPYTRFGRGLGHVSAPEITKAYLEVIILFIFRCEGISLTTRTDVAQYVPYCNDSILWMLWIF